MKPWFTCKTAFLCYLLVFFIASCNKYEISEDQAEVFLKFFGSYQEDVGMVIL